MWLSLSNDAAYNLPLIDDNKAEVEILALISPMPKLEEEIPTKLEELLSPV